MANSNNPLHLAKRPANPKRTLLIDGDVLCYRIGLTAEEVVNWADQGQPELYSVWADADKTKARFKSAIYKLKEKFNADWAVLCVTLDTENFRKELLPSYKDNRTSARKPILLHNLRQFCVEHFGALHHPRLEADDILGILATGGKFGPVEDGSKLGEMIVVSADKDLLCIPGLHHRLTKDNKVHVQTDSDANDWHAIQSIAGDVTDNYAGCPGTGWERAEAAVQEKLAWASYEHVFKSGKRKGLAQVRWEQRPANDLWEIIASHYLRAGLTEEDALVQARCAWILRAENWNNDTQEITLWEPKA